MKSLVFALNSDEVATVMASVNTYHFNVFQLLDAGHGKGMRFLLGELLSSYGLIGPVSPYFNPEFTFILKSKYLNLNIYEFEVQKFSLGNLCQVS